MSELIEISNGKSILRSSIFYITSGDDYSFVYTDEAKEHSSRITLAKLWDKLKHDADLRFVHKGHIIRKSCISEFIKTKNSGHIIWQSKYSAILKKFIPVTETVPVSKANFEMLEKECHTGVITVQLPLLIRDPNQLSLFPEMA